MDVKYNERISIQNKNITNREIIEKIKPKIDKYNRANDINPIISIITSIGYDHMHILGNT